MVKEGRRKPTRNSQGLLLRASPPVIRMLMSIPIVKSIKQNCGLRV
jgi:hypothetical protein